MNRLQAKTLASGLARMGPDAAFRGGIDLVRADYPEYLLEPARVLVSIHSQDPRLAQLLGLAARGIGNGPLAHNAFHKAAALAPNDALIAHSAARAALDAGHAAVSLFERARRLAPHDSSVFQGLAAALVAERRTEDAVAFLSSMLAQNPGWIDGHRTLAKISGQYGGDPLASIDRAIAAHPREAALHRLRITILLEARRVADAMDATASATRMVGPAPWLALLAGHAASEHGEMQTAEEAFSTIRQVDSPGEAALLVRHALKSGRPDEAAATIEAWLSRDDARTLWPYASLAWRLTGDPRSEWLEGWPGEVGIYDLSGAIAALPDLAGELRKLHTAGDAPLDQSVRGGTQTDGNLLLRDRPALQGLRRLIIETVERHVAALPAHRVRHPTLVKTRKPQRIAGSWSVRLAENGFHNDHVHGQGWLSSALYVALPAQMATSQARASHEGWLSLGEARDIVPGLEPLRLIEPKPGRLVLFPSVMWHGTRPFTAGERLTVAFDIALPKQD